MTGEVGLLIGDGGTILRTTDSGATWAPVPSPAAVGWTEITRDDRGRAWIAGEAGRVASSDDDGLSWTLHATVPGSPVVTALSVNDDTIWVGDWGGNAWRADTGPVAWTPVTTGASGGIVGAWTIDAQTAVLLVGYGPIAGTSYVLRTTNGGSTWTTRPISAAFTYGLTPHAVTDRSRARIAATSGVIVETDDGGVTWTPLPAISDMQNLNEVAPIDANRLRVIGPNETLARSGPTSSIPDDIAASGSGFGACASTVGTSSTNWPVTGSGNCTTAAPLGAWQPIAERATDPGAVVATTATNATVDLNFGLRVGPSQRAGAYRAELVFEAVAP
ncbi:MAG: glycosyl hydrolase [Thermoleophilia bacterium]|nr:glycosyl hydrolase [Thermoleophilia bacterium]